MGQSSTETNVTPRRVSVLAVRIGLLLMFISSLSLLTGCANMSSDDRSMFYSGWANPNGRPMNQLPQE